VRHSADVTGGKPIAILSQSISAVSAVNQLIAFYDLHRRKREVLIFCSVLDTRDTYVGYTILILNVKVKCVHFVFVTKLRKLFDTIRDTVTHYSVYMYVQIYNIISRITAFEFSTYK
jgi:hypothetical protein